MHWDYLCEVFLLNLSKQNHNLITERQFKASNILMAQLPQEPLGWENFLRSPGVENNFEIPVSLGGWQKTRPQGPTVSNLCLLRIYRGALIIWQSLMMGKCGVLCFLKKPFPHVTKWVLIDDITLCFGFWSTLVYLNHWCLKWLLIVGLTATMIDDIPFPFFCPFFLVIFHSFCLLWL